ncbi:MAG: DNA polymerase III subunit delta' [Clostridia bacterium]|nr:DNA polymerase III subunit delta' [Clostridia bacterium]
MKLAQLIGNRQIAQTLQNALIRGMLAHAYLFHGAQGVGKRTGALALAQAYLCLEPVEGDSCGQCLSCRKVASGNHPDVHIYRPSGASIKIEQVRELQKTLYFKPYEGKGKVYILEGADTMKAEAANSMLKSMEEPPEDTLLIFIATNTYAILPTILSRCQAMHFKKVSQGAVEEWLMGEIGLQGDKARFVAALADGSLAKALEWSGSEEARLIRDQLVQLARSMRNLSLSDVFKISEEWEKKKEELVSALDLLEIWYRDLLIWQETEVQDLLVNIDCLEMIKEEVGVWNSRDLMVVLDALEEAKKALRSNGNLRLVLDRLFITLNEPQDKGELRRTS